ncbi:hypothetical protein EON67_12505 [archaeon]|nr:MAG: hypothetical protein EON67_12505 [archaeon]
MRVSVPTIGGCRYGEMSEVAELYLRLAKNVVRTVASNYDATQFFGTERSTCAHCLHALPHLQRAPMHPLSRLHTRAPTHPLAVRTACRA